MICCHTHIQRSTRCATTHRVHLFYLLLRVDERVCVCASSLKDPIWFPAFFHFTHRYTHIAKKKENQQSWQTKSMSEWVQCAILTDLVNFIVVSFLHNHRHRRRRRRCSFSSFRPVLCSSCEVSQNETESMSEWKKERQTKESTSNKYRIAKIKHKIPKDETQIK